MTELTSAAATAQATAQFADDPFLILLTLSHRSIDDIRIVRNRQKIVSRGELFKPYPFQIGLPSDTDDVPQAKVTVGNTDREIGETLERLIEPPDAKIELVLASTPDVVERLWESLQMTQVQWDAFRMTGTLTQLALWDEPWPRKRVTPVGFPGLFA